MAMTQDAKATEGRIRARVRAVVYRTLGRAPDKPVGRRPMVTEADVKDLPFRGEFTAPADALITPLARQTMMERQIRLVAAGPATSAGGPIPNPDTRSGPSSAARGPVALGSDHAGFELKEDLKGFLTGLGYAVIDCGAASTEPVDYPDIALAVGELVAGQRAERGILIDGAGIGSCVAANKVPGVRAALCYDLATAVNSREHNDANVLTLGSGQIGAALARQIVRAWLETRFAGGRHARRVGKISEMERRFMRR
jgi:ribose 5-phosphate isomerase B